MNSYIAFLCFAVLLGLLEAARIGDFVKVNAKHRGVLHDKYGLVLIAKCRAVVKVFLHDRFAYDCAKSLTSKYFITSAFDFKDLIIVKPEDWIPQVYTFYYYRNPLFSLPASSIEQFGLSSTIFANLPETDTKTLKNAIKSLIDIRHLDLCWQNSLTYTEAELAIFNVWMNQTFKSSFNTAMPDFCPFKKHSFVVIQGFKGDKARFNRKVGIIVKRDEEYTQS